MSELIDVPAGLNGVAAAETTIGAVHGDAGFYHYREFDATDLARTVGFEDAWYLLERGSLPEPTERQRFCAEVAESRPVPSELAPLIDAASRVGGAPLAQLRTVLSGSASVLGLEPVLDLTPAARQQQGRRVAALAPGILAALHHASAGTAVPVDDPTLGHAAAYLRAVTGTTPGPEHARALEQ